MNGVVLIKRLPFARAELERVRAEEDGACRWCGQPGRFHYGVTSDTRPTGSGVDRNKVFCSIECWRTYTGSDV